MRVLLSYSRNHFDPDRDDSVGDRTHFGTSANVLARSLYESLSLLGDVTYIDPSEHATVAGGSFDLFVGQVSQFTTILDACTIAKSVLFTVNMHPTTRNTTLRAIIDRDGLSPKSLSQGEIVDEERQLAAIAAADHIVGVGNVAVLNSYVENGVPPAKIKMINYGVGPAAEPTADPPAAHRFLYSASDIGLRKGFDIVEQLTRDVAGTGAPFHLDIVGKPASDRYRRRIERLVTDLPAHVTYHGWVEVGSERYAGILRDAAYLLAPALEEGQAGAVLDALRRGVVPIVTLSTGTDFSPLGVLDPVMCSASNRAVLDRAIGQTPAELATLRAATLAYYAEFHENFRPTLDEVLAGCIEGSPHPLVSVTLPIFNKEGSILQLLELFDRAAREYGNIELHVIFDGCEDNTEGLVREFYGGPTAYPVTFEVTPNIFEVKTSNIGLRKSRGKYCVLLQDDNLVYDRNLFFEATTFLDKTPTTAILGCLAGVDFYPLGTRLDGGGQIAMTDHETYWRRDAQADATLVRKFFQVDACMRGPLFLRREFLLEHGYLDEIYAPLYMDDMDIAFRAAHHGQKVFAMLADVENQSLTMAHYGGAKRSFFEKVIATNTKVFYDRWSPGVVKDHMRLERVPISGGTVNVPSRPRATNRLRGLRSVIRAVRYALRAFDVKYCRELSDSQWKKRLAWVRQQAAGVPAGMTVLDIGAGSAPYRDSFSHTTYVTQDFKQTPDLEYGSIDVVSDIVDIPLPDDYADVIVCSEVFEHIPDPFAGLREISRLLKPGGRLIFTAPLGSGHHQQPYHFYGGYTRFWYEKFFPEHGLEIVSLEPNGGLYAHTAEMLWRGRDQVINPLLGGNIVKKAAAYLLQLVLYNASTLFLHKAEERWLVEDFTVCFFVVAQKQTIEETG